MALIYASAMNKRLNSHEARCKRSTIESPPCKLQEITRGTRQHSSDDPYDITGLTDMASRISLNKNNSTQWKCHSEIKRKMTVSNNGNRIERATRKTSTPAMIHSSVQNSCYGFHTQKQNMRRNVIKKRLIQQYGLENSLDSAKSHSIEPNFDNRRKSQSLDPSNWKHHVALTFCENKDDEIRPRSNDERKLSAFKRMRNRFVKWRHPHFDADS